jgi:hypothetical protein
LEGLVTVSLRRSMIGLGMLGIIRVLRWPSDD